MSAPERDVEERLDRIEEVLGLPWRHLDYWIVMASGHGQGRSLDYWGPFGSAHEASQSDLYRPHFGARIFEFPR